MGWFKKIVNKFTDDILGVDPNGGGIYSFFDDKLGIDPNGGGVFSFLKKVGVNVDANDFYKALNDAVSKGLEYAIVYVTKVPVKINVSLFKNPTPLQGKSVNEQFNRLVSSDAFNEQFYRLIHKDVDAEIKAGKMPSGIYHYINYGYAEGRVTSLQFNESFYRLIHKDVDAAIKAGTQSSALQHYIIHGYSEGRVTNLQFNESFYRLIHKDVDAAIKAGTQSSALQHYIIHGYSEGRVTNLQFNESFYRLIHKDVDVSIKAGTQSSALQHYIIHGYSEGRVTNLSFDEQYYRSTNHDVDAEIKAGKMPSAIYHYMNHGYAEGRVAQFNVLNSNDSLWGTSNSDILKGSNGNNFLGGGSGNDKLIGLDGNDTLVGGLGNDILDGGNGIDTAVYTGKSNEYHVVFYSDFTHVSDTASNRDDTDTLLSNVENVQFSDKTLSLAQIRDMGARFSGLDGNDVVTGGKGNDIDIRGNAGHDKLYGLQGNDNLFGNDGNDVLVGGIGADNLTGGAGADRFHYPIFTDSVLANLDRITDYKPTEGDRIVLKSLPSSVFNGGVFSNSTLTGAISAAYADANPNLSGNQALGANQAVFFGWNDGRYVSVNDGLAPFNTNTDLVINVTGMTGTMATGSLTPTNYFAV